MADESNSAETPAREGSAGAPQGGAAGGGASPGGGQSAGGSGSPSRNRSRNRNRNRNRNRGSTGDTDRQVRAGGPGSGSSNGGGASGSGRGGNGGSGGGSSGGGGGSGGGGSGRGGGGGRGSAGARSGSSKQGKGQRSKGGGGQGGPSRQRAGTRPGSSQRGGQQAGDRSRTAVAVAAVASSSPTEAEAEQPGLGSPKIFPSEVAANRRRALMLCAVPAAVPAVVLGVVLAVAVSWVAGLIALVVVGVGVAAVLWRVAPARALRSVGAIPIDEQDEPRLSNMVEGLCATFGLRMPALHVVRDPVPNACALGRDPASADLVVTTGLLDQLDPIELEGVVAHELAHVKRGDNGVSCISITLARLVGGETTLRRSIGRGASREYRADVVGASAVRYPRGLLDALELMMHSPVPASDSVFAPARYGVTRWVWIDPSIGHRDDPVVPGDLDATAVRAAALSEW